MRIFTYSTSAISRQWFHSGKSQWGATAAPELRVQLDGLTSSAGTLCGQTHCPALRWGGEGSSSGLNPNPALSTFYLLSSLKCGNYISFLNPSALEGRLGLPDSWSQWDSLVAIQHKQAEDSECRGEELGWERAGWRLTDSAGAVMPASMILHDLECDSKLVFVFVEHCILPLLSWGNWGSQRPETEMVRERRPRQSERGGQGGQREETIGIRIFE